MNKTILFMIAAFFSFNTFASDRWDECTSSDGIIKLSDGQISAPQKNEEENYVLGKLIKKINIRNVKETCRLKGGRNTVTSLDEITSYEVYSMSIGESNFEQEFICKRGGSGIPAAAECDESTVKKTTTYLVK